jgi:2-keto-4-pentenoate hydratase/2-oxohepta-3-ene-1,7-dioic acid hydratase in catechol pathway
MRLLTHATDSGPRLAVIGSDGLAVDVVDLVSDGPLTMQSLLEGPDEALASIRAGLANAAQPEGREVSTLRLLPPIARPGKILAIGRNYRDHAEEEGVTAPPSPVVFAKLSSALIADGAAITWRASDTSQVDYEAELAVVIGRTARDVPVDRSLEHVLGYTCLDDVSARDLQVADGQWVRAKSLDSFCPMGPWIVTADEIPDPNDLGIRCRVNGETVQSASTREMVHDVRALIAFCSRFMTLEPGDVVATGTPGGVGVFRDPPRFLADGDEVVVEIDRIGRLTNVCRVA